MRTFVTLALIFSATSFAADIRKIEKRENLRSRALSALLPTVDKLHEDGEKEYSPAGGRATLLHRVVLDDKEVEWKAIVTLVDRVNDFHTVASGEEEASAYLREKPSFSHVAVGFVSDYLDEDELSPAFVKQVYRFRDTLRELVKKNRNVVFYKIFSSNEAQGHLGFVLYDRSTRETLYVSTISDH